MKKFEEIVSVALDKNEEDKNSKYYETLHDLAIGESINILACNNHKAICKDEKNGKFELLHYVHNLEKGYKLDSSKKVEVYDSWEDFRKQSLQKLELKND